MTKPLALVHYEQLLPGTQLLNRLRDHGYRVETSKDPAALPALARTAKPLVILAELAESSPAVCTALRELRRDPETSHLAVVVFTDPRRDDLQAAAAEAGADLVAGSDAILDQLPALLDRALQID